MNVMMKKTAVCLAAAVAAVAAYTAISLFRNTPAATTDMEKSKYRIVAHRGGAGLGAENTIECIERGLAAGADAIEVDVHLTADGEVVVCHDATVDRTTDGEGRIDEMTLDRIRRLHVTVDGQATGMHLPTLAEVFECVGDRAGLLIEIKRRKGEYEGIEAKVLELIRRYGAAERVAVQSFNDTVLERMHELDPSIRLEKLVVFKLAGLPVIFDGGFSRFDLGKYRYVSSFNFYYRAVPRSLPEQLHRSGREVKVWTVEGPEGIAGKPYDGIITNRPDLWR